MIRYGDMTDTQLLPLIEAGDGLALETIAARHADVINGVCRSILRDPEAADDAIEATLIVLWRKAGSLDSRSPLGHYLYRVASRIALRARAQEYRRRVVEQRAAEMGTISDSDPRELDSDRAAILHEEIGRLPERFRIPLILCELEGQSYSEAALSLGVPSGTIGSRLKSAKEKLRARLIRRGLAPSVAAAAFSGETQASSAAARAAVMSAARAVAANHASENAVALATWATSSMSLTRALRLAASGVAAAAIACAAGAGLTSMRADRASGPGGRQVQLFFAGPPATLSYPSPMALFSICTVRRLDEDGSIGARIGDQRVSVVKLTSVQGIRFEAWRGLLEETGRYEVHVFFIVGYLRRANPRSQS